jgi:hypothetical protein
MAFLRKLIRFAYWIMLFAAAFQIPINTCPCVTQAGAGRRVALFSAVITALELAEEGAVRLTHTLVQVTYRNAGRRPGAGGACA